MARGRPEPQQSGEETLYLIRSAQAIVLAVSQAMQTDPTLQARLHWRSQQRWLPASLALLVRKAINSAFGVPRSRRKRKC